MLVLKGHAQVPDEWSTETGLDLALDKLYEIFLEHLGQFEYGLGTQTGKHLYIWKDGDCQGKMQVIKLYASGSQPS